MQKKAALTLVIVLFTLSWTICARDLNLTIYNNDLALIRDARQVSVPVGTGVKLGFTDVSALIEPSSVFFKSQAKVREQNFEYDLIDQFKLLQKYLGSKIRMVQEKSVVDGTLLSMQGGLVIEQDNKKLLLSPKGEIELPALPAGLIVKPTLSWILDNKVGGLQDIQLSYLSRGFSWEAAYVLKLSDSEGTGELNGWVTVRNTSGSSYPDAALQLVAGDPHRAEAPAPEGGRMYKVRAVADEAFKEETFFEYHLYDLAGRTDINNAQDKQLSLLTAPAVPLQKKYELANRLSYGLGQLAKLNPTVKVSFMNSAAGGLGMPLPKGKFRIYKADSKGRLQFVGEDNIDHTPKDEKVELTVGTAFDIVAEKTLKLDQRINDRLYEKTLEVVIRNHKDSDIIVEIVESFYRNIKVLNSSHKYLDRDARTAVFSVPVAKDSSATLRYTAQVEN
ncbi:MAG: DUF4139 domain-containing protein [Candidatus Margulisiibacteriota bacterium]|jgi:hypothetical protein